jgi:hypothetical protein
VDLLKDACQNNFKQTFDRAVIGTILPASATTGGASGGGTGGQGTTKAISVDEAHLRRIMFGDYFYPDADNRVYDEVQ